MESNQSGRKFDGLKVLYTVAAFVIVVAGLKEAQSLLVPLLFAVFLSILGSAPLDYLKRFKVPTGLAIVIVAGFIFLTLFGFVSVLGESVEELRKATPRYQEKFIVLRNDLKEFLLRNDLRTLADQTTPIETLSPDAITSFIRTAVGGVVGAVSGILLVAIMLIFMLIEAAVFKAKIRAAVEKSLDFDKLGNVSKDVQRYLGIKTGTSLVTGILVFAWTTIMGVDLPYLWGMSAFILNYIPFIGSFLAAIPAVILGTLDSGIGYGATIAVGYVVINVGISNFIEPIIMGQKLGLSPLVVFLSLFFWGWVWGPSGMLLSIPLTMIVKILLEHSDDFKWIAVLMGNTAEAQHKLSKQE